MSDRQLLQQFLVQHAPSQVDDLMADLEPFFVRADRISYPLDLPSPKMKQQALKALMGLFPQRCQKVVWVSLACPFPRPEWMSQDVYKTTLKTILGISLWDSLLASLKDSFADSLSDGLRANLRDNIWTTLRTSLTASLWTSLATSLRVSLKDTLWGGLWDSYGDSFKANLGNSIRNSLFYFLGFAIAGKTEEAAKLRNLVQLLPQAIPAGEKEDEPGTWLVLCA